MNAVTDVGAPSYTSGVHMWKGTAATLKPSETVIRPRPSSSMYTADDPPSTMALTACQITGSRVEPVAP